MTYEWVSEHEVRFGGVEGALTFHLGKGSDGVLVLREVRVDCGPLSGVVNGYRFFDVADVRRDLAHLLARQDLSGHLFLAGSDHDQFNATIDLTFGRGVLTVSLASEFGSQPGSGTITLTTDQSYLQEAVSALDRALA